MSNHDSSRVDAEALIGFNDIASRASVLGDSGLWHRWTDAPTRSLIETIDPSVLETWPGLMRDGVLKIDLSAADGLRTNLDVATSLTIDSRRLDNYRTMISDAIPASAELTGSDLWAFVEQTAAFVADPSRTIGLQQIAPRAFRQGSPDGEEGDEPSPRDEDDREDLRRRLLATSGWLLSAAHQAAHWGHSATRRAEQFNEAFEIWRTFAWNLTTLALWVYVIARAL